MSIKTKNYDLKIGTNPAVTTGTAIVVFSYHIRGCSRFTVTVKSSATAVVSYSIQTSPVNEAELFSNITATSVAAAGVTKNTFEGNNQAYLRILASSTATVAAGALSVYFSAIEE